MPNRFVDKTKPYRSGWIRLVASSGREEVRRKSEHRGMLRRARWSERMVWGGGWWETAFGLRSTKS